MFIWYKTLQWTNYNLNINLSKILINGMIVNLRGRNKPKSQALTTTTTPWGSQTTEVQQQKLENNEQQDS